VVYTGTHDNEAINGWFLGLSKENKDLVRDYLCDYDTANKWMYKKMVNLAMMSTAQTCVIPIQDWLGLDNSSRMNAPGTVGSNWSWRLLPGLVTEELGQEVLAVTKRFGRANWDALKRL
jgi:4-alpha-glucanotransferase